MTPMNWWRRPASFPWRILLIALVLRLAPVILLRDLGIGLDDMFQYDMLARSLVAGNGYRWYAQEDLPLIQPVVHLDLSTGYDPRGVPTSFRPPLYPAFLALIYFVAGVGPDRFFVARLVQAVLAATLAPLTLAVAGRFFPDRPKLAAAAAWIVALYPLLVIYPLSLATENLFFVLVLSSVLALLKAQEGLTGEPRGGPLWAFLRRGRRFILAGALLGLTALTRSVSLAFAVLAAAWIWFVLRQRGMAILTLAMVAVVTVPWMARNTLLHGRPTGIESALGYDLYLGYHPQGSGTFQYPQSLDLMTMLDDGERDEIGRARAWEFIRADPGRFPYLVLRRAGHFFGLERRAMTYFYSNDFFGFIPTPILLALAAVLCLPFVLVSVSASVGLALISWRKGPILLALFPIGYVTPHLLILGEDRFHLSVVPFLGMAAAFFWTSGPQALRQRWQTRAGRIALCLALAAILLLLANWGLELWRDMDRIKLLLGPGGNQTHFAY